MERVEAASVLQINKICFQSMNVFILPLNSLELDLFIGKWREDVVNA